MNEVLYHRLIDSQAINAELINLIERECSLVHSLKQKYEHGESTGEEKALGEDITARLEAIDRKPVESLKTLCLAYEHLLCVLPEFIAMNNKRMVSFFLSELQDQ